ncbi:tripartite tricarboxylate transporter TctB family protein [Azospirillum halopraeferens]|uniref:tripartite tricarboxylate transporter TctB family protein n=1 Tax=Azospirillum halopraeferens TaxID=34010 RepID=UPI000412D634|nr:tripartite tricarboxylate transporter TctB family protein [Azospirillum halopraeferens]
MSHAPFQGGDDESVRPGERIATLVIAGVVCVVAVAAIVAALDFPATRLATDVGPARFPIVYAVALIGLCGVLAVNTLRAPVSRSEPDADAEKPSYISVALGMAATAAGIFAMGYVGFLPATVVFLFALMRLMGRRNLLLNAVFAVVLTAVIYVAFQHGLNVPLPEGSLFE